MQARLRLRLIQPIRSWVANAIQVTDWDVNPMVIVFAPRLDQEDAFGRVGTQPIGQQRASGSSANDDVIKVKVVHQSGAL
jgi:hypothetical protein